MLKSILFFVVLFSSLLTVLSSMDCLMSGNPPIAADFVIGQKKLTDSSSGSKYNELWGPTDVIVSPAGKLFIVDFANQRVLRYNKTAFSMDGFSSELTIGVTQLSGCNANNFNHPLFITFDVNDDCWVSDESNHRVIKFEKCSTTTEESPAATVALGQANLKECPVGDIKYPTGVFLDSSGSLWISDLGNSRVVMYKNASMLSSGAPAFMQLGSGEEGCGSNKFNGTYGLTGDMMGNIYVVDSYNNRVLIFLDAAKKKNKSGFDIVLGQDSKETCSMNCSMTSFHYPQELEYSSDLNLLFVSDAWNDRVLAYNTSSALTTGQAPVIQIGQSNFLTCGQATRVSASTLNHPYGITYDSVVSQSLLITDFTNNRVLRYCSNANATDDLSMIQQMTFN